MYDKRRVRLIESIKNEIDKPENKMRHMQALVVIVKTDNGEKHLAIKFNCIETAKQWNKVNALVDKYCESLTFFTKTKTTVTYLV